MATLQARTTATASKSSTTHRLSSRKSACTPTWRTRKSINSFSIVLLGSKRASRMVQMVLQRSCLPSSREPFYSRGQIRRPAQVFSRYNTLLGNKWVRINSNVEVTRIISWAVTQLAIEMLVTQLPMLQRTATSRAIMYSSISSRATTTSGAYLCLIPNSLSTTSQLRI